MSLYKTLGYVQWALAFLFLAACANLVVAVLHLIKLATK